MKALVDLLVYILNTIFAVVVFCFAIVWVPLINIIEFVHKAMTKDK